MRILTSIILSLAVSALALSFLAKAEYEDRLAAGDADALVLRSRGESGPETCSELADSVEAIRTKTTTTTVVAVAAIDIKDAYAKRCMTFADADRVLKELRREFTARYEAEESHYKSANLVSAVLRFYKDPFGQPPTELPDHADKLGLFDLSVVNEDS